MAALRRDYPALTERDAPLDPARFVLRCADGFGAQERLEGLVQQQARQLKERPIEIQQADPDPEEIQRQVQAALKKAKKEWKQKAEEEKAAAVKEASEKAAEQAAAEANMELAAARTDAESTEALGRETLNCAWTVED